ncbi:MAG: hypothetical protein K2I09_01085, partial [Duncaniella sp.]|nr:hypothetical protein [Duncaniella sp.]
MKDDKWTSELRRRMADYETPVPEGLWDSIESTLADAASHESAPRRRFIMPWRYASAAAAILFIVFVSGWFLQSDSPDPPDAPDTPTHIYSSVIPSLSVTDSSLPSRSVAS